MKTEKPEGPQEPGNNRKGREHAHRPRRGAGGATTGFGNVMRDVSGNPATTDPSQPGYDPALVQALQLDAGAIAARAMGAVQTGEQLADQASSGVRDATDALAAQDRSTTHRHGAEPHVPTTLGRMTPAALLETVLDEATKLEIEQASRDLHVELDPEHLGPLVVRLRRGPDGALDISFRAREGDAARVLESGSELLRERLADAGFANVAIAVQRDPELRLR